jgi:hypothetical protein
MRLARMYVPTAALAEEQMRMTLRLAGHIEPEDLDPAMERELLDAFRDWKAGGA